MPNLGSCWYPEIGTAGAIAYEGGFRREHLMTRRSASCLNMEDDGTYSALSSSSDVQEQLQAEAPLNFCVGPRQPDVANRQGSLVSSGRFRLAVKPAWTRPTPHRHSRGFEVRALPPGGTRRGAPVSPRRLSPTRAPDGGAAPAPAQTQEECLEPILDAAALTTSLLDASTKRGPAGPEGSVQSPAAELMSDEARRGLLIEALQAQKSVLMAENARLAAMNAAIQRHLRS
jgi:hypothetical protein